MQVKHIIFLIHPCCYEPLPPAEVARDNLQFYVELERKVKTRWLEALAERPQRTLLVQLGGPKDLSDQAVAQLGAAAVFYPRTEFPVDGDLVEYCLRPSPLMRKLVSNLLPLVDGQVPVPTGAGLGIELDEEIVNEFLVRES